MQFHSQSKDILSLFLVAISNSRNPPEFVTYQPIQSVCWILRHHSFILLSQHGVTKVAAQCTHIEQDYKEDLIEWIKNIRN